MSKAQMPDVILMDVNMDQMDGFAATRAIGGDAATKSHPGGAGHQQEPEGRPRVGPDARREGLRHQALHARPDPQRHHRLRLKRDSSERA